MLRISLLISFIIFLNACSTSSHLLVGKQRAPIPISAVKLYTEEPKKFDKIAIIEASSRASFSFTEQQKMDAAMEELKTEAASLGANGVLLISVNDQQQLVPMIQANGSSNYTSDSYKAIKATAIYVTNE